MGETIFDITAAAKEYRDDIEKLGWTDDPYEIDINDIENAFTAGAQWAFEQVKNQMLKDNVKEG